MFIEILFKMLFSKGVYSFTLSTVYILSTHSVLLDILTVINTHYTPYVHILHYVHIYTHNNMQRCNRLYINWIRNVMDGVQW